MTPSESTYLVGIGGTTKEDLLSQLLLAGIRLNPLAKILFADRRFTVASGKAEFQVQVCSVQRLGLCDGGTFEQVIESALQQGLSVCPLELSPQFRLQHLTQSEGAVGQPVRENQAPSGSITVASMPLDENDETPKGFYLRRINGALWLRGYCSGAGHIFEGKAESVTFFRSRMSLRPCFTATFSISQA